MRRYILKMLLILFICSVVVLLFVWPFIVYSFPYLSLDYFRWKFLPLLTADELSHMQDVMIIFRFVIVLWVSALVIFVVSILWFVVSKVKKYITKWLLIWSFITLVLIWLIIIFVIVDFQSVFLLFHKVFFPQGNWSFDASSVLITLFPLNFFETITMKIFVTVLLSSSLVLIGSLYLRKKYK